MVIEIDCLPPEVIVEIFKFESDWQFIFSTLSTVCKNWNLILLDDTFGFYNYLYNALFGWRNNNLQQMSITQISSNNNQVNNNNQFYYKEQLQKEIKIWNNWNFISFPEKFQTSIVYNNNKQQQNKKHKLNNKHQRLLQIKSLIFDQSNLINQPLLYNSGVYYFEIKSLKDCGLSDNTFVGFLLKEINATFSYEGHLGEEESNSFGLYFADGEIYGFIRDINNKSYMECQIVTFTTVGVYLDTNNLKVRFVLVKENKIFKMLNLSEFFTKKQLEDYCNGKLALFPGVSMLYPDDILELNTSAGFKSIKKAKWINNILSNENIVTYIPKEKVNKEGEEEDEDEVDDEVEEDEEE